MKNIPVPGVKPEDQVILFDGVCKFCNFWTRFILRFDKRQRFRLCSVQSPQGQALLECYGFPLDRFETLLVIRKGGCVIKSNAVLAIAQELSFPWRLASVLRWLPQQFRDGVYDVVARNRYRLFGRYDQCRVPSADDRERFLDQ